MLWTEWSQIFPSSSGLFSSFTGIVQISNKITIMFHTFFSSLARSKNLSIFFVFFSFCCISLWPNKRQHNNNDAIMKTSYTVLRKIYLSLYLKGLCVRGSWRPNRPPLLWPSAFLSRSPGLLAFSTASCHQRVWSPNCLTSCLHWVI